MKGAARTWFIVAIVFGVLFVGFVLFVRTDTQSFRAKSEAMAPTLDLDERFSANKEAYDDAQPQRHDIVVVRPPAGAVDRGCGEPVGRRALCPRPTEEVADVTFVKRIVGVPGERLGVVDGKVLIDGRPLDEPFVNDDACVPDACTFRGSITVPDDHYFLMGDNRGASDDSRFWGPVPRDQIIGRVDDCLPLGLRCTEDDRTG